MSLDKKTNSLNQSGAFLQFHVLNELNQRGWETRVETPVSVSPFNKNPASHPKLARADRFDRVISADQFPQAVLESQNQTMKEETSVDIEAWKTIDLESEPQKARFRLCVEVKKNDPRYSDWCFFQQKINQEPMRVIKKTLVREGRVGLFYVPPNDRHQNEIAVESKHYPSSGIFNHKISDFALALQNEEVRRDFYKSEKTIVDEAARQIIKGTYGLIIEHVVNQVTTGRDYDHFPVIFLPVVVTNANLFLCKFNPKDIDSHSGHITKNPEYEKMDSIIYEYPTPKEVQFPEPLSANLSSEFKDWVQKWHVLIMSPSGLVSFLDKIENIKKMS